MYIGPVGRNINGCTFCKQKNNFAVLGLGVLVGCKIYKNFDFGFCR